VASYLFKQDVFRKAIYDALDALLLKYGPKWLPAPEVSSSASGIRFRLPEPDTTIAVGACFFIQTRNCSCFY
jgi:hypothetical protein